MKIYLAESGQLFRKIYETKHGKEWVQKTIVPDGFETFGEANILQSFYYCNNFTEKVIIPNCKNFLLDSGAFTFFSSGKSINWDEYIEKYAMFIVKNNIKNFFELDIDAIVGYDKVVRLRNRIENIVQRQCIPVWHKSRGINNFIEMCEQYKYVAIGGIVSREITGADYRIFSQLISIAHKNGAIIHGLGFTNLQGITKYHFDSVDSSSWTSGVRYGTLHIFDGKTISITKKPDGKKMKNWSSAAFHNWNEWIKFIKFAEVKL